jgi:nitroreductase
LWSAGAAAPVLGALVDTGEGVKAQAAITLPKPKVDGGKPLLWTLSERKTNRNISPEPLPAQVLSTLLWAAFGVNRPDGKRTAPSAMNIQEIDVYVFLPEGVYVYVYVYVPGAHTLSPVLAGDQRGKGLKAPPPPPAGATPRPVRSGPEPANIPVTLVYVADLEKWKAGGRRVADVSLQTEWANAHTGFIAQNVYLLAASEGLASSFRANVDAGALAALLRLRPAQKPLYSHLVGYPGKTSRTCCDRCLSGLLRIIPNRCRR